MNASTLKLVLSVGVAGLSMGTASVALAGPLVGSGDHLIFPNPNPGEPAEQLYATSNVITNTSFDGTWTNPANAPWVGTFHATGPVPAGFANSTGLARYDFTTLAAGELPSGTFFRFGDLDGGSGSGERFVLQAFDAANNPITSAWLDEAVGASGSGSGPGGAPALIDMPSWSFAGGIYTFDGNNEGPNPGAAVYLPNNTPISYLEVNRVSAFANFSLGAPVPAPGSCVIGALALPLLSRRRRR